MHELVLKAGHLHIQHLFPAQIAESKGFFRDEGLPRCKIGQTGSDGATLAGLLDGSIDFALDLKGTDCCVANAEGKDIFIVGGWRTQTDFIFMGAKGINSAKDLVGKRIGCFEFHGVGTIQDKLYLASQGIDPENDVEWVKTGWPSRRLQRPLLDSGEIVACHFASVDAYRLEKEGYPILFKHMNLYPDGYPDRLLATTGKMISENPALVKGFVKGLIKAYRFMKTKANYGEIMGIIEDAGLEWEPSGDPMGWCTPNRLPGAVYPLDGSCPVQGLEVVATRLRQSKKVPESFSIDSVLRHEFCEQANAELSQDPEATHALSILIKELKEKGFDRSGIEKDLQFI